jgi:xanthine/CO dehydrogenase XdhC/CoxF family maturation factor
MTELLETAAGWRRSGARVAIATVVATWGSSPNPSGSQLIVNERGDFLGSVSGGCIEGAVVQAAAEVIELGKPRLLSFGVSNDEAWEFGLACGGKVQIYVESVA